MDHNLVWVAHHETRLAPLNSSRREVSIGTKIVENGVLATKLWRNLVPWRFLYRSKNRWLLPTDPITNWSDGTVTRSPPLVLPHGCIWCTTETPSKTNENHATPIVHNFWRLTPFSTISVPFKSWHSQFSNGTKIAENGANHRKLWPLLVGLL